MLSATDKQAVAILGERLGVSSGGLFILLRIVDIDPSKSNSPWASTGLPYLGKDLGPWLTCCALGEVKPPKGLAKPDQVDTKGQSQDGVSTLRLRMPGTSAWAACNVDDVYVADAATRLGDSRVITLVPDGDTGDKAWSPSSGEDNYAMVDEQQVDGDTSYVASSTPGDLDFYTMGNLGVTPETIHAVQLMMCARKDDAATREVRLKLKTGSTVENGAAQAMGSSYQYSHEIYDEDPDAEGPWNETTVDAMQIGIETVRDGREQAHLRPRRGPDARPEPGAGVVGGGRGTHLDRAE